MLMPRTGNAAIEHVEDECGRRECRGRVEMKRQLARDVEHRKEYRPHAACSVAKREEVRQVKTPQHREVAGRGSLHAGSSESKVSS